MDNIQIEKVLRLMIKQFNIKHNSTLCIIKQKKSDILLIVWTIDDDIQHNIGEIILVDADLVFLQHRGIGRSGTHAIISLYDNKYEGKIYSTILSFMNSKAQDIKMDQHLQFLDDMEQMGL